MLHRKCCLGKVFFLGGSNREGATVSGFDRSADSYQSKSQKKKKKKLYAEVIEGSWNSFVACLFGIGSELNYI